MNSEANKGKWWKGGGSGRLPFRISACSGEAAAHTWQLPPTTDPDHPEPGVIVQPSTAHIPLRRQHVGYL